MRTASAQPANSSPTTQRASKPGMAQKTQPIQGTRPAADASKMVAIGSGSYEEDPCVICHEDMNASFDIVTLECGHRYHSAVRFIIFTLLCRNQESLSQNYCKSSRRVCDSFVIKTLSGHWEHCHVSLPYDVTVAYWCPKPVLWESSIVLM